jgi:putative resolvase
MKLSHWAKQQGISYMAAWRMFSRGLLPSAYRLPTGTIIVSETPKINLVEYTIVYSRVSSSENRNNLESQANRVCQFCIAKGWKINEVVKECASGLNDTRPKLQKILKERKATRLVVEHKDRLTRFGFHYIQTLFPECEIVIINESKNDQEELMIDFVNLVTSFCARLYGKRRSKRKTEQIIKELKNND